MSAPLPVLVGLDGPTLRPGERALLARHRPAGVLLLARNDASEDRVAALCAAIREVLGPAALIAADQEGGPVAPLARAMGRPPSAASLGRVGDPELTRRVHRLTAHRSRRIGVDLILAPVCDLDRPANPVIGLRAFARLEGEENEAVTAAEFQVHAAVTGLRGGGVLACAKHWPGHGATTADSHTHPVRIDLERSRWGVLDRRPFAAALAAGCPALMPGHLSFPSLDARGRPAPLSAPILDAARGLGFRLLVSDALEMAAFGEASPREALEAGCDLLTLARPLEALDALLEELSRDLPAALRGRCARRLADLPRPAVAGPVPEEATWEEARRRSLSGAPPARVEGWALLDLAAGDRLLRVPGSDVPPPGDAAARAALEALLGPPRAVQEIGPAPLDPQARRRVDAFCASLGPQTGLVVRCLRSPGPSPLRPSRAPWGAVLGHPEALALVAADRPRLHLPDPGPEAAAWLARALVGGIDRAGGRC